MILFWAYQILAVVLLAAASMTAYQDLQAMAWRNVAIGEIPEIVVYRNPKGTFTRPVTAALLAAILIQFLVRGKVSLAVPYYGVGVFLPIMAMGLAIRQHILKNFTVVPVPGAAWVQPLLQCWPDWSLSVRSLVNGPKVVGWC